MENILFTMGKNINRILILFLLLMQVSLFAQKKETYPELQYIHKIMRKFSREMKNEFGLIYNGNGEQLLMMLVL
jgi:hypothetical protein